MSNTTFGDYDRAAEDEQIKANPPAAVGNPGTTSISAQLSELFKERDDDHYVTFKATAPNGAELALEFDTDLTPDEWARYQRLAAGNRKSRRSGGPGQDTPHEAWRSAAAMIAEKSTKITNIDHDMVYRDNDGDLLTLRSVEWLDFAGHPTDPIAAALKFFGFAQIIRLGSGYVEATGLDEEAERVDPTRA